jgi:RsiW-degrading membrane proteinase PrsW (M82 family)
MPDAGTLVAAALLAIIPSLLYLIVLNAIDRYEKEPWTIMISAIVLGGILAPLLSAGALAVSGRSALLTPSFAPRASGADPLVAIVEEVIKGGLLLLLVNLIRDEFDDVLDGIVYGAAIGAGFGAAESFIYAAGGVGPLSAGTVVALLIAGLNHAFYTAVFGGVLGYARQVAEQGTRFIVVALGFATAVLLHALHDALPTILSRVLGQPDAAIGAITRIVADLLNVMGLITLAAAILWALRREARILRIELKPELDTGVISQADYDTISSLRARLARQRSLLRGQGGFTDVRTLRSLYAMEGELAFQKRRLAVRSRKRPAEMRTDELRDEVRRLRRLLGEEP